MSIFSKYFQRFSVTNEEQIQRAERAQELLEDPLIKESFDHLEKTYLDAWRDSRPGEELDREVLWQAWFALDAVRSHLNMVMQNGKIARDALDKLKRRTK